MKTFNDLTFKPHAADPSGQQAVIFFDNDYGVSVVQFFGSYTSNANEWELAVIRKREDGFTLTYDTPVTNDVIGHLEPEAVTEIMRQVQALPQLVEA